MAVVPAQSELRAEDSAISLVRYARIIGYAECPFFGVNSAVTEYACRSIWVKIERDQMLHYLAEAQQELEAVIGYPVGVRWIAGERRPYSFPLTAGWKHVLQGGVRGTTAISADEAIDQTNDPGVIGPVATTVTDESEIHVFYPASLIEEEVEIHPSDIDLDTALGQVTIYIPRCRTVLPKYVDNLRTGLDYSDAGNFLTKVDVVRVYNDASTQATLVWPHGSCTAACGEDTQTACIYVRDGLVGVLDVLPAVYSGGSWSRASTCCRGEPEYAVLNYRAGVALTRQAEDAIVRLAHAKMPVEPCGCDVVHRLWERDRNVPEMVTRERLNCPFGLPDGAWAAWTFAESLRVGRAGIL